jgi:RHS repeat-associated protein
VFLVWQRQNTGSGYDLYARPLDSNGLPNGDPFVIQESNGNQQNPAIAQGSNQRYQLAWQDDGTGAWDLFTATLDRRYQVTHIQYDYDPLNRLVSAVYSGDLSASYSYTYDAVGNMTAYVETVGAETSSVNRTFNEANQLVTSTDTELGTSSFTYDANGNLTQLIKPGTPPAGRLYYHYNQRNLLTLAEEQIGAGPTKPVAEFVYDGDGGRLQQIDHTGEDPLTTTYTNDIVGLSQVLVSDDGTTTTHNLFGLDLISQDDGTTTRYLLADGLGSVRVEMVNGAVETTTTYEPYGKLLSQTGSSGTTYSFTGEQYDAATGLVYLRARYYNPSLKLFLSRDPFPGYATLSISQNGYAYVHANPINLTDPSGEIVPLIIGGVIIAGVTGITWDVMINQGASVGGAEQIFNGILRDNLRCNVNWAQAMFYGGVSMPVGAVAAPVAYVPVHLTTVAMAKAGSTIATWLCLRDGDCFDEAEQIAQGVRQGKQLTYLKTYFSNQELRELLVKTNLYDKIEYSPHNLKYAINIVIYINKQSLVIQANFLKALIELRPVEALVQKAVEAFGPK